MRDSADMETFSDTDDSADPGGAACNVFTAGKELLL
jgi:hypothetical protein